MGANRVVVRIADFGGDKMVESVDLRTGKSGDWVAWNTYYDGKRRIVPSTVSRDSQSFCTWKCIYYVSDGYIHGGSGSGKSPAWKGKEAIERWKDLSL